MIQFGNDKIKEIYLGGDKIKEVYYGSELVWQGLDGYWVHKDTNAVTYFGLEDPSIENGIMSSPSWRYDCSEVKIPSGVTSLGESCFLGCGSLTSINIPDSVTSLGESCFAFCASLTPINIPEGVTSIGAYCFDGCTSLTSITLPESVTILEAGCFYQCSSLTSITLPESLTSIGEYCFYECESLTSIDIPAGVTSIGQWCFNRCESLTSITIPESVTSLGDYCFNGCVSLTSINLSEGVTILGGSCFEMCLSLTSITIPESVTSLGRYCFGWCDSLTLATVLPAIPPSLGSDVFYSVHPSFNIKVNSPYVDDYKTTTNWISYADIISGIQDGYWVHKDTGIKTYFWLEEPSIVGGIMSQPSWRFDCSEVKIPEGVTSLGEFCFADCLSLTSINIPEGVTSLGGYCFYYCESLTSIILPESVTSLGESCFNNCTSLTSITLPESVTSLGGYCFYNCTSLTSITLPESVTSLGEGCFQVCTSLTSITIPEGVTSLREGCFYGCTSLISITLPESVTSLGEMCFTGCTSLILATVLPAIPPSLGWGVFNDVHSSFNIQVRYPYVNDYKTATNWVAYASKISAIPDGYWVHKDTGVKTYFGHGDPSIVNGIMSKPSWRFDCSEVNIPEGVTSLGEECFFSCRSLTSITLPESIISLGNYCFEGCGNLASINIPEGIISLGEFCFAQCTPLTSIDIPESVTSIGNYCFFYCSALTLATVLPATPPSMGSSVFTGVHSSFNIKVSSPYVNAYKTATGWKTYAAKISAIEPIQNGGWKHKDTGAWTEFNEFYPHYGNNNGIIEFNGYGAGEPNSVANIAHNISELIIREGCQKVGNIGLVQHPDTQVWLYEHLILMDFPSTITDLGVEGGTIFGGLANVEVLKIRALSPPAIRVGNMQSPLAKIYVPDAAVATYKSHPDTSPYAAIIFPLSDIE